MDKGLPVSAELQRHLNKLSEDFTARLGQELPQLALDGQTLLLCTESAERVSQLLKLRDRLHKLAGAAGTFGLGKLGERARELEQQADAWVQALQQGQQNLEQFCAGLDQLAQVQLDNDTPDKPVARAHKPKAQVQSTSARRIYILEDQVAIGENMRLTLNSFGYHAEHFSTMADLDAAMLRLQPDALIVDVNLPDEQQSGLEYAASLQKKLAQPLPLLVITTHDEFATQLEAVRVGAQGYFVKPVDIPQLENRLERCFAQQQGEPYRVLIIDDDRELACRYSLILRGANMHVEMLHDPAEIFTRMRTFNPEVVLLDVNMPDCTGPELAQIIRFNDDWLRVPIIYLSAETSIAQQMSALIKAGDDFVTKPISDNALVTTVFSRAQRARLLSDALSRDSLTGLLKHADIKEQVGIELERANRSGKPASVAMLDIDFFKKVNDSHGHAAGDNVIRALANLLRQRLRRIDSLGRYGGEEFLVVLPDCPAEQAWRVLDEIRQRFAELHFIADAKEFSVTLSAGIASTESTPANADTLLETADRALYSAKNGGRNQVR
jgi:diguanylate cyclase (GGDEF)-like protein